MRREGFHSNLVAALGVVLCLGLVTALGGCSLSGAVKGAFSNSTPSPTYDLVLDHGRVARAGRLDQQLVVTAPQAVRVLAGDNILVKPSANEVTYYGNAVWGDRLPKLLQARMVEAMRVSGRFRAVSDGSDRINAEVTLASTIEAFQVEVAGERAEANVTVFAKLIHVASGKVYASKKFVHRVPAQTREVGDGVAALNEAANLLMADMTRWVVKRGRMRMN